MTTDTLEQRRQYVKEIKSSFNNPNNSDRYRDVRFGRNTDILSEEAVTSKKGSAFAVKFFLAILLFSIFVYCDRYQVKVQGKDAEVMYTVIKENRVNSDAVGQAVETWVTNLEKALP